MKPLVSARILLLSADEATHGHLAVWLQSEGAHFSACTWGQASEEIARLHPTVLIADLQQSALEATQSLSKLQLRPEASALPVVAIIGATPLGSDLSVQPRVNKYLRAPLHPADVVGALSSLAQATREQAAPTLAESREELFAKVLTARAERKDLLGLLGLVNTTGPFRYTSILRFDKDAQLTSLWTFDREHPMTDSFPTDMTVASSYCERVLETKALFEMPDAALDPTVQNHPARHAVLSYCGVPLIRADGTVFGTLCQFDAVPRYYMPSTPQRLTEAASVLSSFLPMMDRANRKQDT